jgi:hypothetical protein
MKSSKSKSDEPYDEFYASLKLTSGEEILALVMVDNSGVPEDIVVSNPVVCEEIRSSGTNIPMGYKFEPWMKLTDDDTFVISLKKVITKDMGYINSVSKARDILEKLYKSKN